MNRFETNSGMEWILLGFIVIGLQGDDTMGLDDLEAFLRKKGAPELITEIGRGTATFNELAETVAVSGSTVSARLSEGVDHEIFAVSHQPTEHGTEKRYTLTLLGRRIYDWAEKTEFDRKVRELRRIRQERETVFEQMVGKLSRDMEIRKMVLDVDPLEGEDVDLPEGASFVQKEPSEEALREAKFERMEESLEPITDDQAEETSE
jgi:DNA-binding HxlR family transcriptional regulator